MASAESRKFHLAKGGIKADIATRKPKLNALSIRNNPHFEAPYRYVVTAGSHNNKVEAEKMQIALLGKGFTSIIDNSTKYPCLKKNTFTVVIGTYLQKKDADKRSMALKKRGFKSWIATRLPGKKRLGKFKSPTKKSLKISQPEKRPESASKRTMTSKSELKEPIYSPVAPSTAGHKTPGIPRIDSNKHSYPTRTIMKPTAPEKESATPAKKMPVEIKSTRIPMPKNVSRPAPSPRSTDPGEDLKLHKRPVTVREPVK